MNAMSSHTVTIQRTDARLLDRWEAWVDGRIVTWTVTRFGAIRAAKRRLRALDRGVEVYMVPDKWERTP